MMLIATGCRVQQGEMYTDYFPPAGADSAEFYQGRRIHDFVASLAPHTFNGSLIVEKEEETLLREGYGYASWIEQEAFRPQTISHTGSFAQQLTAAAILKLAAKEKLALTDPLLKFFKDLPEEKSEITLDQLLRHTAGLPQDIAAAERQLTKEEFLEALWQQPLVAPAGAQYQYSEAGYRLLAAVVEKVSRKSYESYIQQELLKPAGLKMTGYVLPDFGQQKKAGALGDVLSEEEALPDYKKMAPALWHIMGSSGVLSTVEEMHLWQKELLEGKLLPADFRQRIWTAREGVPEGASAYGWVLGKSAGGKPVLLHNSGQGSYVSQLYANPEEEIFMSLLANKSNYQVERLSGQLARSLMVPSYSPTPTPAREQKFVRLPHGEEAAQLRTLVEFAREEKGVEPVELINQTYSPAFQQSVQQQQHVRALGSLRAYLQGASLEKVNRVGRLYSLMLHQPKDDVWYLLRVEVEPLAPHLINSIELEATNPL